MSRILFGIVLCLLLNVKSIAQQTSGYFYITGSVKVDQGLVDDTQIQVFRDGALLNNVLVNRTGNFRIKLDLNHVYSFNFNKENYYSKTVELDAHVPPDVCDDNCVFPPYQMTLMLYRRVPGINEINSEVGRISYNSQIDNFDAELINKKSTIKKELLDILSEIKKSSVTYEIQTEKVKKEKYRIAVSEADELFRNKQFDNAMHRYRDAVLMFPEIEYSRTKVNEAYSILIAQELDQKLGEVKEENFMKYLNYGDDRFKEREYSTAKVCYEKASQIKPDNTVVKSKLYDCNVEISALHDLAMKEISQRKLTYNSRKEKYNQLVNSGDEQFKLEQFAMAKDFYSQAATQIGENSYAILMIKKIEELISNDAGALKLAKEREAAEKERFQIARNQAYKDAISEADHNFQQRLYRDAIENYELALTIKSYEIYPFQQIKLIKTILASLQLNGEEYNRLVREADALFNVQNYANAKPLYEKAHQTIPDEKYALLKLSEIDQLLAQQKNNEVVDQKYITLLRAADQLFQDKKYVDAIAAYQQAGSVKPNEDYPKQQIKKIRGILSSETDEQKRLTQRQNDYNQVIRLADDAFTQQSYSAARSLYQEALQVIPGQEYPSSQIKKINGILSEKAKQQTTQSKLDQIDFTNLQNLSQDDRKAAYEEAMQRGTEFMKSQEWGIARFYFRRALALYPEDPPATQKLNEVDQKISGSNVNETKYTEMVKKADEAFKTGDFGVAKFYYSKARESNPTDQYVNERLSVVATLAESNANRTANKEFDLSVKKANDAFEAKNYSVAKFFYRKALNLKPVDEEIKKKIEKIDSLINVQ